jgi:hypothetical protein
MTVFVLVGLMKGLIILVCCMLLLIGDSFFLLFSLISCIDGIEFICVGDVDDRLLSSTVLGIGLNDVSGLSKNGFFILFNIILYIRLYVYSNNLSSW